MPAPKLFISYSWTTRQHEDWVLKLAESLVESGVDVILDKWHLKEGQETIAFMEKMVTDKDIKKVLIVTDKTYAEKADDRSGGVGTEAQIISREIYESADQSKFVAVLPENDEGEAFVPTYYKSRIYIDLSDQTKYADNFEKLLRWVYDKPLHKRPELGATPAFLDESQATSLGTSTTQKRAISLIREGKATQTGAIDEYLNTFVRNFQRFRVSGNGNELEEAFLKSIDQFLPYRNEYIQFLLTLCQYSPKSENASTLHRFFESLMQFMYRDEGPSSWNEEASDNFKFLIHELFLYTIAIFIQKEQFEIANQLMKKPFYTHARAERGGVAMVTYIELRNHLRTLETRNKRLDLNRLSLHADILKQRCDSSGLEFRHLLQADFVLFMRREVEDAEGYYGWWPVTLVYIDRHCTTAFEIFARARSKEYFNRVKVLLGIESKDELSELLLSYKSGERRLPKWQFETIDPYHLLGYEYLSTLEYVYIEINFPKKERPEQFGPF